MTENNPSALVLRMWKMLPTRARLLFERHPVDEVCALEAENADLRAALLVHYEALYHGGSGHARRAGRGSSPIGATVNSDGAISLIRDALEGVQRGLVRKDVPGDIAAFAVRPALEALGTIEAELVRLEEARAYWERQARELGWESVS